MLKHNRGQIIVPTGGGKTMCMIQDAMTTIDKLDISTICRSCSSYSLWQNNSAKSFLSTSILMMLRFCTFTVVMTKHLSTTKVTAIEDFNHFCWKNNRSSLIFTTYNSLHKVYESRRFR